MEGAEKDPGERVVTGTFQAEIQLTQQRRLVITGHLYSDDTLVEMNARIDMAQDALDRQYVRCDLVNKRAQRENLLGHIKQQLEQLEELKAKQLATNGTNGGQRVKLTSQQQQILKQGDEAVRGAKKNIEMFDGLIAEAEKKLKDWPSAARA